MNNYKTFLIKSFTFLGGAYFLLRFLLPKQNGLINFENIHEHVINGFTVVGSLAIGLGILNLVFVHGSKVIFKKSNWIFSFILLFGLLLMLLVQFADWFQKESAANKLSQIITLSDFSKKIVEQTNSKDPKILPRKDREVLLKKAFKEKSLDVSRFISNQPEVNDLISKIEVNLEKPELSDKDHESFQQQVVSLVSVLREKKDQNQKSQIWSNLATFLNQGLFVSLGSAMFSLLGFYIAAAAYRAFRIRSVEASLMMLSALIVMLGQIPFGVWISEDMPELRLWLLQVPSSGAARAIEVGSSIAGLVLAIRIWLSLESESFKR